MFFSCDSSDNSLVRPRLWCLGVDIVCSKYGFMGNHDSETQLHCQLCLGRCWLRWGAQPMQMMPVSIKMSVAGGRWRDQAKPHWPALDPPYMVPLLSARGRRQQSSHRAAAEPNSYNFMVSLMVNSFLHMVLSFMVSLMVNSFLHMVLNFGRD